MLLVAIPSAAEDAAPAAPRYVHPSVEELAIPQAPIQGSTDSGTADAICLMIESAARANGLPLEFFARVIWQESRFQSDAVGPMTRSGTRAQGIAQFMPGTASERGLLDPFNPVQALPKSAEFLAALRDQFGNLGLAAAAYNAGPRRVQEWLAGTGSMPYETRNYVSVITGSLLLITAGYTNEQVAPAFGLFGTIIGYMLGRMHQGQAGQPAETPPGHAAPKADGK